MNAPRLAQPGDKVAVWKDGFFLHPMIYVGNGWLVEKAKTGMVQLKHWAALPKDQPVRLMQRAAPGQAAAIVQRAVSRIGPEPYHPLHANCQHFANEIMTGERKSEQVAAIKTLALAGLATAAVIAMLRK